MSDSWLDSMYGPINIPRHIDRFLIVRKWKEGGFSTLYAAVKLSHYFICKAIPKKNYIGNEIEIQNSLSHDNIQEIVYHCEDEENIYIFTFLAKESLQELLDRYGKLNEDQAKYFMYQILDALQYVHAHDISYCDIKPDNFLITQYSTLLLIDFGCAVKGKTVNEARGTPFYMSPECISNQGSFDGFANDIWGCGVILYQMLMGKLPFGKPSSLDNLKEMIKKEKFQLSDDISDEAKDLLSKMIHQDPSQRISALDALNHNWLKSAMV